MKKELTLEYWIERAKADYARDDYESDEEYEEAIQNAAERDLVDTEEETEAAEKEHVWDLAKDLLYDAGLYCCGRSEKSRSTYFGRGTDSDGCERIRLSDHSVAYACSDCAVCIEIGDGSPDADVIISDRADDAEIEQAIAKAVSLFETRCPEESEEDDED